MKREKKKNNEKRGQTGEKKGNKKKESYYFFLHFKYYLKLMPKTFKMSESAPSIQKAQEPLTSFATFALTRSKKGTKKRRQKGKEKRKRIQEKK